MAVVSRVNRLKAIRDKRLKAKALSKPRAAAKGRSLAPFAADFIGFAALLDIIPKDGTSGRVRLRPNAIQSAFEVTRSGRDIVLKPRQVGFTTWELARDVWYFLTKRGVSVSVVCQSITGNGPRKELAQKIDRMLDGLVEQGFAISFRSRAGAEWIVGDSKLTIVEAGASEASADKKGRAGTIHRLHITELAFFEFAGKTLNAILECVPRGGPTEIVVESTPNGASGTFYAMYHSAKSGKSGYKNHFFNWLEQAEYQIPVEPGEQIVPESPREQLAAKAGATPAQIKWARWKIASKDNGGDLFDQEYPVDEETCWLSAGRLFFDREKSKAYLAKCEEPSEREPWLDGELRTWRRPERGKRYVIVADPSEGVGQDPGVAGVFDHDTGEHVATLDGQFPTWEFGALLAELGHQYTDALIVVERNNHGHAVLDSLTKGDGHTTPKREPYANVYLDENGRAGWNSTPISRASAIASLQSAHANGHINCRDRKAFGEFLTFVIWPNGKPAAANGAHDDHVMMLAVAHNVMADAPARIRAPRAAAAVSRWGDSARGFG